MKPTSIVSTLMVLVPIVSISLADDIEFLPGASVYASVNLVADSNGVLQIDRTKTITVAGVVTPGPVTPDPIKPVPEDDARITRFRKAAEVVDDPKTAKSLMALFQGLAQRSDPTAVIPLYTTPEDLQKNVTMGMNLFLTQSTKPREWDDWRDLLNDEWVEVAKQGGTMTDYSKLMYSASAGLGQTTGVDNEVFDIQVIFKILQILGNDQLTWIQKVLQALPLIATLFI